MERMNINILFILVTFNIIQVNSFMVTLSDTGPVVMGANITFKAELFNYNEDSLHGQFRFKWKDNAIPPHTFENDVSFAAKSFICIWNVSYPAEKYAPGPYEVDVTVYKIYYFDRKVASNRISFNVTGMLNGKIISEQTDNEEADTVVSNAQKVVHNISLQPADYAYITQDSYKVLTFWFIDCVYYGYTNGFTFVHNYTQENVVHEIEALVVASYEPMVTTTIPPPTTSPVPHTSTNASTLDIIRTTTDMSTVEPTKLTAPYLCLNKTIICIDPNKTYGYFQKYIKVVAPVHNVVITGTNWLQHGDIVYLNVKCNGSSNFTHCYYIYSGVLNVTGGESCAQGHTMPDCNFTVTHYFKEPGIYTIIIIINNDVSKVIKPMAINVYEVAKQPQLSVIVVPVTCSVIAVVIIVFGVAYYVQSKMRYTVEVADFDFGQVESMEYKTFKERLWQDVMNAFNRSSDYVEASTSSNVWSPNSKYSNMQ